MYSRFYPYHEESDEYPEHMAVDFRKLRAPALVKYCKEFDLPVKHDDPGLAVTVARHFETTLDVEEDECITRFLSSVRRAPMASRHGMQSPMAGHMVAHPAVYQQQVVAHPGYMHPYDGGVPEQLQAEAAAPAASEQQMIGCDHPECVKQWYNISDVGLTPATVPSGDWYCPACRETEDDYSRPRHRKGPRGKPKPGKRARRR
ncbi:hypothetical protein FNF27_05323 [Cafeteria roenbergensis]|uniref:Histone deacetylase complex subunit SAP30 Sin3 binding domain-containing protein n=1 Tax=Cafeteria roenbergensis TaxID=33653 RepID=A0A5A8D104_CAFRO|nr:hypothetical protein FNF29_08195 [Cafeteria roenbergensis]KAA0158599.1 hypothetical protein FNF31_05350 [Cafeteria roenbergensis]KAA0171065.1 hypothetical protein FNF28_01070 [Cafeteria roenbergensis]KAA0173235.1 hypothetical protein FNF27_05323 [Cafeteria roenbergensis]|eukprot:KAA0146178.1 hypothetical protein FNF29_08195 [Cafeteria roenbergensis]